MTRTLLAAALAGVLATPVMAQSDAICAAFTDLPVPRTDLIDDDEMNAILAEVLGRADVSGPTIERLRAGDRARVLVSRYEETAVVVAWEPNGDAIDVSLFAPRFATRIEGVAPRFITLETGYAFLITFFDASGAHLVSIDPDPASEPPGPAARVEREAGRVFDQATDCPK